MRAPVAVSPFSVGRAAALFTLPESSEAFDVAPDGRLLILFDGAGAVADEIRVILGWSHSLRR